MIVFSENSENLQFVLDQRLSDHKPILAQGFLSWNMLCLCRVVNNGFQMDEAQEEGALYKARLQKTASLINEWVHTAASTEHPIEVICLQEAPLSVDHLEIFLKALHLDAFDRESIILTQTGPHKFQNVTLYSKHYSGRLVADQKGTRPDCQKDRYHIIELIHKETGVRRIIGNVHFAWFSGKKVELQEATRTFIKELLLQSCSLMGDFNQSLTWILEDPDLSEQIRFFYYPEENNISFLKDPPHHPHYGRIDALILV